MRNKTETVDPIFFFYHSEDSTYRTRFAKLRSTSDYL